MADSIRNPDGPQGTDQGSSDDDVSVHLEEDDSWYVGFCAREGRCLTETALRHPITLPGHVYKRCFECLKCLPVMPARAPPAVSSASQSESAKPGSAWTVVAGPIENARPLRTRPTPPPPPVQQAQALQASTGASALWNPRGSPFGPLWGQMGPSVGRLTVQYDLPIPPHRTRQWNAGIAGANRHPPFQTCFAYWPSTIKTSSASCLQCIK